MPLSEHKAPDPTSKSQAKRDMLALQALGEALLALSDVELDKMQLENELREALAQAKTLKTGEGKRRHLQYIGKLMRNVDVEPIKAALDQLKNAARFKVAKFHQLETWRERLILEGDVAIQAWVEAYPETERQLLRQLVRKAQQERASQKNRGADTVLFRFLQGLS